MRKHPKLAIPIRWLLPGVQSRTITSTRTLHLGDDLGPRIRPVVHPSKMVRSASHSDTRAHGTDEQQYDRSTSKAIISFISFEPGPWPGRRECQAAANDTRAVQPTGFGVGVPCPFPGKPNRSVTEW